MHIRSKRTFLLTLLLTTSATLFFIAISCMKRPTNPTGPIAVKFDNKEDQLPFSFDVSEILQDFDGRFALSPFKLDSQSLYRVHESAMVARNDSSFGNSTVCLATIASLDHLRWIPELSEHWTGPTSIAVFYRRTLDLRLLVAYLTLLRTCFKTIGDNFNFHFVTPALQNATQDDVVLLNSFGVVTCDDHKRLLESFLVVLKEQKWDMVPFPQNHLRNVARDGCARSPFFYLTDVDVMPQYGLHRRLDRFLMHSPPCEKCLYVVPAFEGTEVAEHPRTKKELLARTGTRKDFRVYHQVAFYKNQRATNFDKWKRLKGPAELHAAYEVNFEFGYECFYVGTHDVPKYREIIIGYGFTRNVQTLESYLAGFRFLVLSDAFMIHRGLRSSNWNAPYRNAEKRHNYHVFLKFRRTLQERYGRGMEFT
uniref:Beta-1,4-glucuronyltransferase 1 n=1 Tax=Ixodes ricinus TaxID=34613 RepID=A0A147BFV1_IXORI